MSAMDMPQTPKSCAASAVNKRLFQNSQSPHEKVPGDRWASPGIVDRSRSREFRERLSKMESVASKMRHMCDIEGTFDPAGELGFLWNDCKVKKHHTLQKHFKKGLTQDSFLARDRRLGHFLRARVTTRSSLSMGTNHVPLIMILGHVAYPDSRTDTNPLRDCLRALDSCPLTTPPSLCCHQEGD